MLTFIGDQRGLECILMEKPSKVNFSVMAACDNTLASECQRMFSWVCHQQFTLVLLRDVASLRIAVCCACARVPARLRSAFVPDVLYPNKSTRRPLMITTHHRHSVRPSWSTLFSPIPLEDYSRVPPASPAWLSSSSHIDRANIKHCFFLAYLPADKKKKHETFHPCVKSICLSKCSCRYTVNASSPSSLFCSLERFACDCHPGRVVIVRLTGMHNIARGKARRAFFFSCVADTVTQNKLQF